MSNGLLGTIYLLIACLPAFLIFLYRKQYQGKSLSLVITVMCALLTEWVLCNAIMQFCQADYAIIFWHEAKYIGIAYSPVLVLMFALEYTSIKLPLISNKPGLLFILPTITVLIIATNPFHHFFRASIIVAAGQVVKVYSENAWWYNVHAFYSYTLIGLTILLFLIDFLRQPRIYRRRPGLILLGITVPTFINFLFDSGFNMKLPLETTPLALILSMLFVYYALFIYRPVRIIPIARNIVVENMDNPIILVDNNDAILDINLAASRLLKNSHHRVIGQSAEDFPLNWSNFLSMLPAETAEDEILTILENEGERFYKLSKVVLNDKKNKPIGTLIVLTDISDLKRAMMSLEYLGIHDQLTGLKNRVYFETQLQQMDRKANYPLGIIIGDVNGLKLINDAFGHESGDLLLKEAATIILNTCPEQSLVARIGGDEFAIVIPDSSEDEIVQLIQAIRKNCLRVSSLPAPLSIAFGFAIKTEVGPGINNIMKQADEHMYKLKMLESRSIRGTLITTLQKALEERNIETMEHMERTRKLAVNLGINIGLPDYLLNDLSLLAILHDTGKLGIPDEILLKPGPLNAAEWEVMKTHSEKGYHIASSIPEMISIAEAVLHHHEHWNGKGYPYGLRGLDIPLLSRLISIVDAFDVMTHDRPYHRAISQAEALEEIRSCAGSQFDPELCRVFIKMKTDSLLEELNADLTTV
jgi:diguanylate cyclase (GGDEF)-like protein